MRSRPTARLLSCFEHPVQTIYCLWKASRTTGPIPSPAQVAEDMKSDHNVAIEVLKTFEEIIHDDFPVAENLDFVFLLEHVPVSLREQMVRHRIGHRFGENFGVDIVPGDVQDSWWSQTSRILDMGTFAADEAYFTPDTIDSRECEYQPPIPGAEKQSWQVDELYQMYMKVTEGTYRALVEAGIPREDARQILPLAATSRISWKMNYMSMKHIVKRRTCWIAQAGMWAGIVQDMVNELAEKIHPVFRSMAQPPCFKKDNFVGCPFTGDNLNRVRGNEPYPPCPLFLNLHRSEVQHSVGVHDRSLHPTGPVTWDYEEPAKREAFDKLKVAYGRLWGRNVWTGEKA